MRSRDTVAHAQYRITLSPSAHLSIQGDHSKVEQGLYVNFEIPYQHGLLLVGHDQAGKATGFAL